MFLKCFFHCGGTVDVEPIFLPVGDDGVRVNSSPHLLGALPAGRRTRLGASDIPYAIKMSFAHPEIRLRTRLRRTWSVFENHVLWSEPVVLDHGAGRSHALLRIATLDRNGSTSSAPSRAWWLDHASATIPQAVHGAAGHHGRHRRLASAATAPELRAGSDPGVPGSPQWFCWPR